MCDIHSFRTLFALTLSTILLPAGLSAQDAPATEATEAAPKATPELKLPLAESSVDPTVEWKKALDRRLEIFNRLQALKKDFAAAADNQEKTTIREEYVDLIREFEVDLYPRMLNLAGDVYAANPDDLDAGEIVMKSAFNENQFEKSAGIAARLLAANRKSRDVLGVAGVSQFAVHNFEQAEAILSEAEKLDRLEPRYQEYVDYAHKYVELWKTEQAIREKEAALEGDAALPRVEFDTSKGKIVFELFEDQAPNTVANFINLVEAKKYDGMKFHRVINGFMAQGGDPNTLDEDPSNDGYGGPGYSIKCECYAENARMHFQGSLSMAHSGPDTGGSQFFITHLPTDWLNARTEPQKSGHTVFGRVVEGMDVSAALRRGDAITSATVIRKRPHEYKAETTPDPAAETPADDAKDEAKKE